MKYNKILLVSVLIFVTGYVSGQKTLTFEGAFQNGIPARATARYSYYLNEKNEKVKHGSFRYLVKEKTRDYRLMHNFQGEYVNGFKNGEWEYSIKSKDYGLDAQGFATSSEIILKAGYNNGIPEGRWEFSAYITKRKKIKSGDKPKWSSPEVVKDVKIILNFKNGILVDSLKIVDNQIDRIDVLCDDNGFIDGSFRIIRDGKPVSSALYKSGFLLSTSSSSQVGIARILPHYEYYMKTKDKENKGYEVEEHSLFDRKSCVVANYLNDNVFNRNYFLFNYIDGDKIIKRDSRGRMTGVDYKGLKYKMLKVVVTRNERDLIKDITYYRMKVVDMARMAANDLKKASDNRELKSRVEALNAIAGEMKSYQCIVNVCKDVVILSEVLQKSRASCGERALLNGKYNSKEELLKAVLLASKSAFDRADKLSKRQ